MKRSKTAQRRKPRLAEYFEWSRGEQRGMLVLVCLVFLSLIFRLLIPVFFHQPTRIQPQFSAEILQWLEDSKSEELVSNSPADISAVGKNQVENSLFFFNPNIIDDDEWKKLGLNQGQIRSIRNFLERGGQFRKKSDFAKMYVIDDATYDRLEPWIDLPDEIFNSADEVRSHHTEKRPARDSTKQIQKFDQKQYAATVKSDDLIIELNTADTNSLKQLRGIGSWLANKIINMRNDLGGFYSVDQLLEIYRMTPEKLDALRKNLMVDVSKISKRNINTIDETGLKSFPYLNSNQRRALISFRTKHGAFRSIEEIRRCALIDEKTYEKLAIYFDVQ